MGVVMRAFRLEHRTLPGVEFVLTLLICLQADYFETYHIATDSLSVFPQGRGADSFAVPRQNCAALFGPASPHPVRRGSM